MPSRSKIDLACPQIDVALVTLVRNPVGVSLYHGPALYGHRRLGDGQDHGTIFLANALSVLSKHFLIPLPGECSDFDLSRVLAITMPALYAAVVNVSVISNTELIDSRNVF